MRPPCKERCEASRKSGRRAAARTRGFRRVEKFDGKEGTWKKWRFQFKTQVLAASRYTRNKLDEIQKEGTDPDWDMVFAEDNEDMVDKMGAELYSTLTALVSSDAQSGPASSGVQSGLAWPDAQ